MFVLSLLFIAGGKAFAVEQSLGSVAKDCEKELTAYCKDVTPGEGRILACLNAYDDKLTVRCEYALYEMSALLGRSLTALAYMASECRDDIKTYCLDISPGQGRVLQCIDKNRAKVSSRCKQALKETELKK
jgi:hypothetical protein